MEKFMPALQLPSTAKAIPAHKPTGWYLFHGQLAICTPENAPCSFSLDTQKYTNFAH